MTITIGLSSEEETRLRERAMQTGQDLVGYVHDLIARDLHIPESADRALAPFRSQVAASGLTETELDELFEEVREDIWSSKAQRS